MQTESKVLEQTECPECPSSDAYTLYDDGHAHCFSCGRTWQGLSDLEEPEELPDLPNGLQRHNPRDLPVRKISRETCRLHGYGVLEGFQYADYKSLSGAVIAQKVRGPDKSFHILGNAKKLPLWQMNRWKPGGRRITVTEGEIDCLTMSELFENRWPVVSVPNGAAGAAKSIRDHLEYVESFDAVILMFDDDEPGRMAAAQVAELLSPGKAHIVPMPSGCKDPNDCLVQGRQSDLLSAYWNASPWRPDGIVAGEDLWSAVEDQATVESVPYPWMRLNEKLLGLRYREIVTLTAGTGIGKSQFCRALAAHLIRQDKRVGYISLEESLARTTLGVTAQFLESPLSLLESKEGDLEAAKSTFLEHVAGKLCVFNHFGSLDAKNLLSRCKYMRIAEGVDFIILDHLSILVSGWNSADGDERRLIDNVMTSLRSTVERTGVGMILVSHLSRGNKRDKSHEEGGIPSLRDLRGSQSIAQLSDAVIGLSRDQQGESQHKTHLRVLKNRHNGLTGDAGYLEYAPETGMFTEVEEGFDAY